MLELKDALGRPVKIEHAGFSPKQGEVRLRVAGQEVKIRADRILEFRYVRTVIANKTGQVLTCELWQMAYQMLLDDFKKQPKCVQYKPEQETR